MCCTDPAIIRAHMHAAKNVKSPAPGYLMLYSSAPSVQNDRLGLETRSAWVRATWLRRRRRQQKQKFPGRCGEEKLPLHFVTSAISSHSFAVSQLPKSSALIRYLVEKQKKNTLFVFLIVWVMARFSVADFMWPLSPLVFLRVRVASCQVAWKTMQCDTRHKISQRFALRNMFKRL